TVAWAPSVLTRCWEKRVKKPEKTRILTSGYCAVIAEKGIQNRLSDHGMVVSNGNCRLIHPLFPYSFVKLQPCIITTTIQLTEYFAPFLSGKGPI
ncbi:MAG: hypothetical protein R6V15_13880, partial [Desulfotignum sp.]